jgi:hypothetical protein
MAKLLKASEVGAEIYYKIRADYLQKIPYGHEYVVPVAHDKVMAEKGLREDHIAFRTFACPMGNIPQGIEQVERIFRPLGWLRGVDEYGVECRYDFPHMHVRAIHVEFPADRPDLPKMFISELVVDVYAIARLLFPFMPETNRVIKEAVLQNKKPENLFPRLEI